MSALRVWLATTAAALLLIAAAAPARAHGAGHHAAGHAPHAATHTVRDDRSLPVMPAVHQLARGAPHDVASHRANGCDGCAGGGAGSACSCQAMCHALLATMPAAGAERCGLTLRVASPVHGPRAVLRRPPVPPPRG